MQRGGLTGGSYDLINRLLSSHVRYIASETPEVHFSCLAFFR